MSAVVSARAAPETSNRPAPWGTSRLGTDAGQAFCFFGFCTKSVSVFSSSIPLVSGIFQMT